MKQPDLERKATQNTLLKQSIFQTNANGNVQLTQRPSTFNVTPSAGTTKRVSNEQLYSMITNMQNQMNVQNVKIDEIGHNVLKVGGEVMETKTIVQHRVKDMVGQMLRNEAKDTFRPQPQSKRQQTLNGTPKGEFGSTSVYRQKYSTVVKSQLLVTPQPENGQQRKRQKTISLIDNETGTTIETATLPSPQQGTKDVELGKPVDRPKTVRNSALRHFNALSEAFCVSNLHPETTTEEIEYYIIEHTQVKDKSKFKVTKMVKKDADLSQLTFVTFKIAIVPELYNILYDRSNWPKNKTVREFRKMLPPKSTLNDFVHKKTPTANASAASENDIVEENAYSMEILDELNRNVPAGSSSSVSGSNNNNNETMSSGSTVNSKN